MLAPAGSFEFVGGGCGGCLSTAKQADKRCLFGCMEPADSKFIAFWAWQSAQMLWGNGPAFSRTDGKTVGGMRDWVKGLEFDIAIIHLGTNDVGHGFKAETIAGYVGSLSLFLSTPTRSADGHYVRNIEPFLLNVVPPSMAKEKRATLFYVSEPRLPLDDCRSLGLWLL